MIWSSHKKKSHEKGGFSYIRVDKVLSSPVVVMSVRHQDIFTTIEHGAVTKQNKTRCSVRRWDRKTSMTSDPDSCTVGKGVMRPLWVRRGQAVAGMCDVSVLSVSWMQSFHHWLIVFLSTHICNRKRCYYQTYYLLITYVIIRFTFFFIYFLNCYQINLQHNDHPHSSLFRKCLRLLDWRYQERVMTNSLIANFSAWA